MHGILTFRFYWMLENYWRRVERVGEKLSKQFLFNCKLLLKCSRSKEKMRIHFFPSLWVHVNCENAYKWKPSRCELIHFLSEIEKRADIASIIPFIVFFFRFLFSFLNWNHRQFIHNKTKCWFAFSDCNIAPSAIYTRKTKRKGNDFDLFFVRVLFLSNAQFLLLLLRSGEKLAFP